MAGRQRQQPPPPVRPWANPGTVKMLAPLYDLPKHPKRWLQKFNLDDGLPAEENLHNYMLGINLNGVVEEDCVVRLFPNLQGLISSWYFSLPPGSITNWNMFEEKILAKFGDDRTTTSLINDLSNLKEKSGEKIKDFNSRINKLLNKILVTSSLGVDVQIEWYISSLPSNIAIFLDRANKAALVENMKEALFLKK